MQPALIKHLRNLSGLTQKQLAKKLGVHDSLISKIEAGTVPATHETEIKMMNVFTDCGINAQVIYAVNNLIKNS